MILLSKRAYLLPATLLLTLAACGTSTLGGGAGGSGGTSGTGGTGGGLCAGEPNPPPCDVVGCPAGSTCVIENDPNFVYSTGCGCLEGVGWVCDSDEFPGKPTCVLSATDTCGGVPRPVSCTEGSCPDGFSCVKDPDPTTCHPLSCSCVGSDWACTADCDKNGSSCVVAP